jgi:hypothetical protein
MIEVFEKVPADQTCRTLYEPLRTNSIVIGGDGQLNAKELEKISSSSILY